MDSCYYSGRVMPTNLEILYANTVLNDLAMLFRDWAEKEQNSDMRYCWRAAEKETREKMKYVD